VQITGIDTIIYYTPKIIQSLGVTAPSVAILPTIGIGIINVLATALSVWLLDRTGRRKLLLIGLVGMIISLSTMSIYFFIELENFAIIIISIMTYVAFFAISLGAVAPVIISEIYPLRIKGKAISLATLSNSLCNYLVTLTFLPLIHFMGVAMTFSLYACITAIAFWFVYVNIPETRGKKFEEIEQMFKERKK
jgi:MFS family permease